jgi:polyisoprenoid-binding protein YceI
MKKLLVAAALAGLMSFPALAQKTTWELDPAHSNAQFVVRHLGISNVQGEFTKVSGKAEIDDQDMTKSSVEASIDMASVDTRNSGRDGDLKGPNFFDVGKYPTMTFHSKKITREGDRLKMTGDLMLHGVTKEVSFDVDGPSKAIKDPWGNERRGVSATTKINRQDFGVSADSGKLASGDMMVGDLVSITLDIEMVKK